MNAFPSTLEIYEEKDAGKRRNLGRPSSKHITRQIHTRGKKEAHLESLGHHVEPDHDD